MTPPNKAEKVTRQSILCQRWLTLSPPRSLSGRALPLATAWKEIYGRGVSQWCVDLPMTMRHTGTCACGLQVTRILHGEGRTHIQRNYRPRAERRGKRERGGEWKNSRVEAGANGGAKGGSAVPAIVDHLATLEAIAPARNHNKCVASNVSDRTR